MRGAIIAALAAVAAQPAHAVPPLVSQCSWDIATQRLSETGPTGPNARDVFPYEASNAFVSWVADGPDNTPAGGQIVLQHCPSDNFLIAALPNDTAQADAILQVFSELVYSEATYSLRQIGDVLAPMGASVRVGQENIGRCGCDDWGYGQ